MKPYGLKHKDEGCRCYLCKKRGYPEGLWTNRVKKSERQEAKSTIKGVLSEWLCD